MKLFFIIGGLFLSGQLASAQELPHRMRVGLSGDLFGATLGIGLQLHGSFRISDDYRAINERHHYINAGWGTGQGFLQGQTRPHYLTYGIGRGRAMLEIGYAGVNAQKRRISTVTTGPTTFAKDVTYEWKYQPGFLIGYRYTAYSGFLFRVHLATYIPGVSVGWVF